MSTRCLVLHPDIYGSQNRRAPENALAEAISLALALELEVCASRLIKLSKAQAGLLFGKGKIEEIAGLIEEFVIDLVLIDGPVTPIQQRNLEKHWGIKVLDRTGLILEIFGARAATREGVLQVDLAALAYQRSRLVRSWTHLERQRGGLSFVGGAGETQIEADRRAIDDAIVRLKRQLTKTVKTRALHRAARKKVPYPIVALVGYTNAGKSTIFNSLTGANVMAKDMLFATLDPTMRAVKLPSGRDIILSDTVGFISELPTQLVAAFRATLEEVLDADLILHIRDITHPETSEQLADVEDILSNLGVSEKSRASMIEVWNKFDQCDENQRVELGNIAGRNPSIVTSSAITGEGLEQVCTAIDEALQEPSKTEILHLDHSQGRQRAWLFEQSIVDEEKLTETGFDLTVVWTETQANRFQKL